MKKHMSNTGGFVLVETLIVAVAVAAIFALLFKHFYPLMGEYEVRENYDDIDSKYGTFWIKKIIEHPSYQFDKNQITEAHPFVLFSCNNIHESDSDLRKVCNQLVERLEVSCDDITTSYGIERCVDNRQPHIYITRYQLSYKLSETGPNVGFKQYVENHPTEFTSSFGDYVNYLPSYKNATDAQQNAFRIIIEYYRHRFDTEHFKKRDDASGGYETEDATNEFGEATTQYITDDSLYEVDKNDFLSYSTIGVRK